MCQQKEKKVENISFWVGSVILYSFVWFLWDSAPPFLGKWLKRTALIALLCLPININGNVFTVMGNATSEKSVYALFSIYQKAGQNAFTFFGLSGYQNAGQNAAIVVGLSGYQKAGNKARTIIGVALYQKVADKGRAFGTITPLTKD